MRILAVDDDRNNLKMVAFLLSEEGYEVITTDDGTKALSLVDTEHPDLVIL
ncbi:MAG: response regulator, partial [Chloroflexi bacterium]|nr:response regulator [Chloroflexota bacterium]